MTIHSLDDGPPASHHVLLDVTCKALVPWARLLRRDLGPGKAPTHLRHRVLGPFRLVEKMSIGEFARRSRLHVAKALRIYDRRARERPYAAGDRHRRRRRSPQSPRRHLGRSRDHPAQTLKHFDQGNCTGMPCACLYNARLDRRLGREPAAYGPLAPAPPCQCCIRKG
jgi:hypothetical protein